LRKGDIVVIDNLALHPTRGVREALEELKVIVPEFSAYSPNLNPIEQAISKPNLMHAFTRYARIYTVKLLMLDDIVRFLS
jgi:transposase